MTGQPLNCESELGLPSWSGSVKSWMRSPGLGGMGEGWRGGRFEKKLDAKDAKSPSGRISPGAPTKRARTPRVLWRPLLVSLWKSLYEDRLPKIVGDLLIG